MDKVLQNFCTVLRKANIRVSVSETMDAVKAVNIIGYSDKEKLKYALETTLTKIEEDKETFDKCFELFFSMNTIKRANDDYDKKIIENVEKNLSDLTKNIVSEDNNQLMETISNALQNIDMSELTMSTQQGLYINKILGDLGINGLDSDIMMISNEKIPGAQRMAVALEKEKKELYKYIEDYVKQQYQLYNSVQNKIGNDEALQATKFSSMENHQIDEMARIIQKLAKKLYALHSRKRKIYKKGVLDIRKTLRKNSSYQGYIFVPKWKHKKITKPEVFVICDISNSVKNTSKFMLMFLYSLNKTLLKVRSFAMCSNLVEISHMFEKYKGEEAIARILSGNGIEIMFGATDFGQSFQDFKNNCLSVVRNTSTVIVLGDARNNDADPKEKILKEISDKCKTLIWLNPEQETMWGAGDSEMKAYLPYCDIAKECNTLDHLNKILDNVLKV